MQRPASDNSDASRGAAAVLGTDLRLKGHRGKVRDVYELPQAPGEGQGQQQGRLLLVASDRLSAFDVVLPTPVPGKGRLLTEIAAFWLQWIESRGAAAGLCRTHLLSTDAGDIPAEAFEGAGTTRESLVGRITIGRKCEVLPIECVVRGALEGTGWKEYQATGAVCGVRLPAGLDRCAMLDEPIFTPATKALQGEHDENIDEARAAEIIGPEMLTKVKRLSLAIYRAAAEHARDRGIIIADTKFEFGVPPGENEPILIDEALTPDSSRFWPLDEYEPGRAQPSFDKQFVREYLLGLRERGEWDGCEPGPELPTEVVEGTMQRYREVIDRLKRG